MSSATNRRRFLQATCAAGAARVLPAARAADGKVVLGYVPGVAGVPGLSALLKAMQGRYQPGLGLQPSYVTGNSGAQAIASVHRAPPDGGTVLLTPSSLMTLLPQLRSLPGVDPVTDFLPVASLTGLSVAFAIGPTVPAEVTQFKDYLAWMRNNPGLHGYGVPGLGSVPHLLGSVIGDLAELPLKAVAYRGFTSLVDDLCHGSLPAAFLPRAMAGELARAARVRLLAVSSAERWPHHPGVPTLRGLGVIDFETTESQGFFVSARTAPDKASELAQAVRQALVTPGVAAEFAARGLPPALPNPPDYGDVIARERQTWAAVIKKHRFTLAS